MRTLGANLHRSRHARILTADGMNHLYASATDIALSPTPPSAPPPPAEPPLPIGWTEVVDPVTSLPYYVHDATRQTQWERPTPPAAYSGGPPMSPPPPPDRLSTDSLLDLFRDMPSALSDDMGRPASLGDRGTQSPSGSASSSGYSQQGLARNVSSAAAAAHSMGAGRDGVSAKLSLELSATGLRNRDWRGHSDPVVVVDEQNARGRWIRLGQTEILENDLNPHWTRRVTVSYRFEAVQKLRFTVYDVDGISANGKRAKSVRFLGQLTKVLSDIVVSGSATYDLSGKPGDRRETPHGRLCIRAHEFGGPASYHRVFLSLKAVGLDRADGFLRKSDPYFTVNHIVGPGHAGRRVLLRSKYIPQCLDPQWPEAVFNVDTRGEPLQSIELSVVLSDWDANSTHDPLGKVDLTLAELVAPGAGPFDIINKHSVKYGQRSYKNSGTLHVTDAKAIEVPSHVAYLQGGCHVKVMTAVDFSTSGGEPNHPNSPHHSKPGIPSVYSRALRAIGNVVSPFLPEDQMMTAYGFSGQHELLGSDVCHAFPLNPGAFSRGDPRVLGVENLVGSYEASAKCVTFSSPAKFGEIVRLGMECADTPGQSQELQHYTILLILTNGVCKDEDETVRRIAEASETSPLSIVIVGVGDKTDWSQMQRLDGTEKLPETSDGKVKAARDIVHFVRYQPSMSAEALAAQVLAEVPGALREFFALRGIVPNPAPEGLHFGATH